MEHGIYGTKEEREEIRRRFPKIEKKNEEDNDKLYEELEE